MSRRVLVGLLLVSAALNVSFVAGFFYYRSALRALETPEGRAAWAVKKLGLDERQRASFRALHEEWRGTMARVQREHGPSLDALWAEAVKDDPDPRVLRTGLAPLLDAQRETTEQGLQHILRVFEILNPEQRRALVELIRQRSPLR